jgi:hypothetical protein
MATATPVSSLTPYCTAARFLQYHDWQQVADMAKDGDAPRPTRASLVNAASEAGGLVANMLMAASGELDSAVLAGKRYDPVDLAALVGNGAEYLAKIVADLAFWRLCQRRQPGTANPERVPGAKQALDEMDKLRAGERIFAFLETQQAGVPSNVVPQVPAESSKVLTQAGRLFGNHGTGGYGSHGGYC